MEYIRHIKMFAVGCLLVIAMTAGAWAQEISGRGYYAYSIDVHTGALQHFTVHFGDSGDNATNGDAGDNATDADSALLLSGSLSINLESEVFGEETGSYLLSGRFFNGLWEASQSEYSAYYQETLYTQYSFFIAGLSFGNSFFVGGIMNINITEVSVAKGTVKSSGVVPFIGVLTTIPE